MIATDHYDKVNDMLSQGMTTKEIVDAFASQSDKWQVAAILSAQPDPQYWRRYRAGNKALITFCVFISLIGLVGLVDAYDQGKNWTPWALSIAGDLGLAYGFLRRRLWAYVGFPVWLLCGLLIDLGILRGPEQATEPGSSVTLVVFYVVAALLALMAWRIRRRLYPYAGFRGPRRTKEGQLAILADLESETPSRAV